MQQLNNRPDLMLAIAVGASCQTLKWKNKEISWQALVDKLTTAYHTYETVDQYKAMSRDDQSKIKDVGGFVGGELKEGKRKNGYVLSRSIVTLDVDFATPQLWKEIEETTDYAMAMYSTHKHTPGKPRYRLVIPLSRKVDAEEYEAIARKLADDIGMDYFDDTTYEPTRLMFWPSTPKDGEFLSKVIDAPILNPDAVLERYTNWRDTSYWPESSRCVGLRKKSADKQGDPLMKDGIVGAFCRTYTIEQAIDTFIPEAYSKAKDNRYTYNGGSTAAGLVIYDNKFAYSNHGTDPISGQLCNAFDLVRIHLFHELDTDCKPDTPINKKPSWIKMVELATLDPNTKITLGTDRIASAKAEFEATGAEIKEGDTKWLSKLQVTKSGKYESSIDNMMLILENDPNLRGLGGRNLFSDKNIVTEELPWPRNTEYWSDLDDAGLRHYLETTYGIEGRQKLQDATTIAFEKRAYHPVRNYLNSLKWDGTSRCERLLVEYLGAPDTAYTHELTRKTLVAAVKRIFEPGCKFDYMLTLIGEQGIGKSLLFNVLAGEWFSDSLSDVRGKEAFEALDGVWIMEMAELSALRKSDREAVKNFITKQTDTYRKAYARNVSVNKRQCIFIGTTNDYEFLNDATGGRRFWVMETNPEMATKTVWDDLTAEIRDQIWAEAMEYYKLGENINYLPNEILVEARLAQKNHSENNALAGLVENFLEIELPIDWNIRTVAERYSWVNASEEFRAADDTKTMKRDTVCAIEIWCEMMGKNASDITNQQAKAINECLAKLPGWERVQTPRSYGPYGSQRGFKRIY